MRCFPFASSADSTGDRFRARQALDIGGRQSQVLREYVGGVLSEGGCGCAGEIGAVECGWQARREIVSDTRLVQRGKEWICSHPRVCRDLREGAVLLKQHGGIRQR